MNFSDLFTEFTKIESVLINLSQDNVHNNLELIISSKLVSNKDLYYILLLSLNFIMQSRPLEDLSFKMAILTLQKDFYSKQLFQDENEIISIFMFNEIALFHLGFGNRKESIKKIDQLSHIYPTPLRYNPRYFSEDLFEKSIREDDIDTFQNLISRTNKSLSSYVTCPSVNPLGYFSAININQIQFISYSAFFGSLHIFKYLWMNEKDISQEKKDNSEGIANNLDDLVICAIAGGNYEIIHIIDKIVRKSKFALSAAVRFFRFELIDYLIETCDFKVGMDELFTSIQCFNFHFFKDYCSNVFSSMSEDELLKVVFFAANCGNTLVLDYINNVLHFDISKSTEKTNILIESVFQERINVLRYIFYKDVFSINDSDVNKKHLFNVNNILSEFPAFDGLAILHLIASNGLFMSAKFFLSDELRINNQVFVDWNIRDFNGATPLHWSVLFQNFEMFKLLISNSNAFKQKCCQNELLIDVNAVNNNGQNILHMACNSMAKDIIKYILENEIIDPKLEDKSNENIFHYAARNGITYIFDYSCIKNIPKDVFNRKNSYFFCSLTE